MDNKKSDKNKSKNEKILTSLRAAAKNAKGIEQEAINYQIKEIENETTHQGDIFNSQVSHRRLEQKIYKEEAMYKGYDIISRGDPTQASEMEAKKKFSDNKLYFLQAQLPHTKPGDTELAESATTGSIEFDIEEISVNPLYECQTIQFIVDNNVKESITPSFKGVVNIALMNNKEFEIIFVGKGGVIISLMFFPCQYLVGYTKSTEKSFKFKDAHMKIKVLFKREIKLIRKNAEIIRVYKCGHSLENYNLQAIHYCCVCDNIISFFSQAYRCTACRFTCHKSCSGYILFYCKCVTQSASESEQKYSVKHELVKETASGLRYCNHCGVRIDTGECYRKCVKCISRFHDGCKSRVFDSCGIDTLTRHRLAEVLPPKQEHDEELRDHISKAVLDDFQLVKVLGRGSFGKVMLARHKTDQIIVALKVLKKENLVNAGEVQYIELERNVLAFATKSNHPFLMKMLYCFQDAEHLYFGTEFLPGGDLFHHSAKGNFTHYQIKLYACEILLGLGYLHENDIIYRDMKLDNILLAGDGHIKIADFGLCKNNVTFCTVTFTFCGTPDTIAPDILMEKGYTKDVDWWSYGVVLYEMYETEPPFNGATNEEMMTAILHGDVTFTEKTPEDARDLILKLLERNPIKRLGHGAADFKEIMRHKYFSGVDFHRVLKKQIRPVFVPSDSLDDNFDTEFMDEKIHLTACEEKTTYDTYFKNFN